MNESGRKKREWVKTAAIVFLSVMLVLTFFSSTIQNWSLPEVATQYVQSGTITAKAMITGTIESVDPYEVKVTESRKVASVAVRAGTAVQKGDVLIYLEDKDSTELETAKKALEKAQADYNKAILSDKYTASDISEANKGVTVDNYRNRITRAQSTVEAAEGAVKTAEAAADAAAKAVKAAEKAGEDVTAPKKAAVDQIQQEIQDCEKQKAYEQSMGTGSPQKVEQARKAVEEAEKAVPAAQQEMEKAKADRDAAQKALDDFNRSASAGDAVKRQELEDKLEEEEEDYMVAKWGYDYSQILVDEAKSELYDLENSKTQREDNIIALDERIAHLNLELYNAQKELTALENAAKADTEARQRESDARKEELEARQKELKEKQEALQDLVARADNVTGLQSYLDAIDEAQKKVDELSEKAGGTTITAPISGTVTSINVTAGNETSPATPVAVMQREGQGFTLKYSAANDVAKRLSVGDVGDLVNAWRYDDVTVTLASIQPDPDSRGQNKLLTFNVTGSVVAGQSLSFSVGQKSSNYNFIVPNSAIREDNNGKFILIVESKGSPLGTRYTASRVDVQVIASDETQSAVSGALSGYEFVITTSTKPVEAGSLVRLPD